MIANSCVKSTHVGLSCFSDSLHCCFVLLKRHSLLCKGSRDLDSNEYQSPSFQVTETPLQEVPVTSVEPCCWEASQTLHLHLCQKLKHPRPIAFQHTALDVPGQGEPSSQTVPPTQWSAAPGHKMASAVRGCFEHRRAFQQQLIEEQKRQLQEQQELILELQEEQRLRRAKEEAEQATAVTRALNNLIPKAGEEKLKQSSCKNMAPLRYSGLYEPWL